MLNFLVPVFRRAGGWATLMLLDRSVSSFLILMLLDLSITSFLCLGELVEDIDVVGALSFLVPVFRGAGGRY